MTKNWLKFILITGALVIIAWAVVAVRKKNSDSATSTTVSTSTDSAISTLLKVRDDDNIRGDENAEITIVDYSDYQCPYCVTFDKTVDQVLAAYPTQVRWVYRHFPLPFHLPAKGAAIAAEAAGAQGKYWEFHDKLVANSQPDGKGLATDDLTRYATELGLNLEQFTKDLQDPKYTAKVENDLKAGNDLKIQGTPAAYIINKNGKIEKLAGALSLAQMRAKIDPLLAE